MAVTAHTVGVDSAAETKLLFGLSDGLGVGAFLTGLATYAFGGSLTGPPAMNGSARGTTLIMFLVGAPALLVSSRLARRGSVRAWFVWAGMTMFLTYNAFMMLTATPINRLFLLYVATFGLAVATMIGLGALVGAPAVARRCGARKDGQRDQEDGDAGPRRASTRLRLRALDEATREGPECQEARPGCRNGDNSEHHEPDDNTRARVAALPVLAVSAIPVRACDVAGNRSGLIGPVHVLTRGMRFLASHCAPLPPVRRRWPMSIGQWLAMPMIAHQIRGR